jgi:hypothetical protein
LLIHIRCKYGGDERKTMCEIKGSKNKKRNRYKHATAR